MRLRPGEAREDQTRHDGRAAHPHHDLEGGERMAVKISGEEASKADRAQKLPGEKENLPIAGLVGPGHRAVDRVEGEREAGVDQQRKSHKNQKQACPGHGHAVVKEIAQKTTLEAASEDPPLADVDFPVMGRSGGHEFLQRISDNWSRGDLQPAMAGRRHSR